MRAAARAAGDYVERALRPGHRPGHSEIVVLDHFGAALPRGSSAPISGTRRWSGRP
jgi:hypothetical protein